MRLLHRTPEGNLHIRKFGKEEQIPAYAALSHTWLAEDDEITFKDIQTQQHAGKRNSLAKIMFCANRASIDGLDHVWIDTCCIDRSDTSELQESITSMFRWYRSATKCYVYLADVTVGEQEPDPLATPSSWEQQFRNSRWFTRGWTLQELLAPVSVEFYSAEGTLLGKKNDHQNLIEDITGIPCAAIQGEPLGNFTIAERFQWAEDRRTTRREDKAYSLFGIFAVFLPTLYGEGDNALVRLRDAIETKEVEKGKAEHFLEALPISSSAAFDSMENQYGPVCLENTRVDLLDTIDEWVITSGQRLIYWLNGVAGSGKSTVARTVARRYQQAGLLGGSFFFSRAGGDDSRADRLFTTLSSQLARNIPQCKRHICDAIAERRDIAQKGLRDQWEQLIVKPLSRLADSNRPSVILLVIDALDECKNTRDIEVILSLFARMPKLRGFSLKIFVTGRPEAQVRSGIRTIPETLRDEFILHEISANVVDQDLKTLFEVELAEVRHQLGPDSKWPGPEAIDHLVELSCGLFIWAKTSCNYIRECRASAATLRLNKLRSGDHTGAGPHKSLDLLYLTVLAEAFPLDSYDQVEKDVILSRLKMILGAIITLKSHLPIQALANLLYIEPEIIKETLADLHTIMQIPEDDCHSIRLHHPTFRDFLIDEKRCTQHEFWIDEQEAHTTIADCCRKLMSRSLRWNMCELQSPSTRTEDINSGLVDEYIPIELQYACLMWAEHLQQSSIRLQDGDSTHEFLKAHYLHWIEALNIMGKGSEMTAILRIYQSLVLPELNPQQLPFVKDARDVMSSFRSKLKETPLQLYCAPLMYIVPTNSLRLHFWGEIHSKIHRFKVVHADNPEVKAYHYQNDISFTRDGQHIIYGSLDGRLRIWNVATKADESLAGHEDQISSIALSPDGQFVASSSDDFTIKIYDLPSKTSRRTLRNHTGWINSVSFSPDGRYLVSGSMDGTVRLWDPKTGEELRQLKPELSGINSVRFSPDGSLIAVAAVRPVIELYDVHKDRFTGRLEGHQSGVTCVRFSADGTQILSGSDDATVRLWNTATGDELMVLAEHDHKVCSAEFGAKSSLIASGSEDKTIKLWNATSGELIRTLRGHTSGICALTFSPDEATVAAVGFNDEVRFWHTQSGEPRGKLSDNVGDGSSSQPGSARAGGGRKIERGHPSAVVCMQSASDGAKLASGCRDGLIKVWTRTGEALAALRGHRGAISSLTFSSDSCFLASTSTDSSARIWDLLEGEVRHILRGHSGPTLRVCITSDQKCIATCSKDKTIKLWDFDSGSLLRTLEYHQGAITGLIFSPDNGFIASCSEDKSVRLWEVQPDPALLRMSPQVLPHDSPVNAIAFSPDEMLLLSCSTDTTLTVWRTSNWTSTTLKGHTQPIVSGAFSSDSKRIVSAAADGTIMIWDVEAGSSKTISANAPIKRVAFSRCGEYIETDRGSLRLALERSDLVVESSKDRESTTHSRSSIPRRSETPTTLKRDRTSIRRTIFATKDWVCYDSQQVVWLPEDHSVECAVTCGPITVLGHISGSITFLNL